MRSGSGMALGLRRVVIDTCWDTEGVLSQIRKSNSRLTASWRGNGCKLDGSESNASAPSEPDAVVEGEFHTQTAAGFNLDAKRLLLIGKE